MVKRGIFITFEGIDGSGKSTHVKMLCDDLKMKGLDVIVTKEPSPGRIGSFIRENIERGSKERWMEVEALLFAADRFEHVKGLVEPSLREGKIVVSDRYIHSSLAYQGGGGLDLDWIKALNRFAPMPDLSILLDVSVDTVLKRISRRRRTTFEEETYLEKVRAVYLKFAREGELLRIDAERPLQEVHREILEKTDRILKASDHHSRRKC
ncbi:MAG: dTMP kinase [Candidatus Bathyarchaeia archaeon]